MSSTRVFADLDEFAGAVGESLGTGQWHTITQEQVNLFADATGDHQWIHVDTEKAAKGPFGTTIAHGYLTLSLIPKLGADIYRVEGLRMGARAFMSGQPADRVTKLDLPQARAFASDADERPPSKTVQLTPTPTLQVSSHASVIGRIFWFGLA